MEQKKNEKNVFIGEDWGFIENICKTSLIESYMKVKWDTHSEEIPDKDTEERIRRRIMQEINDCTE